MVQSPYSGEYPTLTAYTSFEAAKLKIENDITETMRSPLFDADNLVRESDVHVRYADEIIWTINELKVY
jgi:hypothetical protein